MSFLDSVRIELAMFTDNFFFLSLGKINGLMSRGLPSPLSFSLSWRGVCAGVLTAKALESCLISIEFPSLQRSHLWGRCEEWSQTIGIILLCHWGWHGIAQGVISLGEASLSPLKDRHLRRSLIDLSMCVEVRLQLMLWHPPFPVHCYSLQYFMHFMSSVSN